MEAVERHEGIRTDHDGAVCRGTRQQDDLN